jgi:hypothetical protein
MSSKLQLIIEKGSGSELWGRVEGKGDFLPTTIGKNETEIKKNIRMLIQDYLEHGGASDKFWKKVNPKTVELKVVYEIAAFFDIHSYLNISSVAERAGLNKGLVRQYASGVKRPSKVQATRISATIKALAKELQSVELV